MTGFDAIIEAKIAEAQAAGAFDDLPGAGRPLDLDDDRLVPEHLRMAYRILKNAGLVPAELEERKEAAGLREFLASAAGDSPERRRALARLALLEARLESAGLRSPRTAVYHDRLLARLERNGSKPDAGQKPGIGRLSL
ncbi:MAG: DnaJ family domain-containing protein [Burkholderiales bacterium]